MSLPGRFGDWCNRVLARLAGGLGGSASVLSFPSLAALCDYERTAAPLDEMGRALIGGASSHFAIALRQADPRLSDALMRSPARLVLALDDPCAAVGDLLAENDLATRYAVRAVAGCCASILPVAARPGLLTVCADDARADPVRTIAAIAGHFELAVGADAVAALAAEMPPPGEIGAERLPAEAVRMAHGALDAYRKGFAGAGLDRIIWVRDLFFILGDATVAPTAPLDIAGGARCLIYGPYIRLPAGSWSARVVLGFSPEAATARFLVDVFSDGQLASTSFQPGRAGFYTAELIFSVGEPSGKGVEVRVWVASDNAVGRLALGHVVLQPLAMRDAVPAEADGDFERVLDL